ncbi:MAG: AcrR family transcriptional regulator [Cellvibrionaceae bacterium]|jgi:AcrR family transcriptional regulator
MSRDKEYTRKKILDAALDVFSDKGYHNTKLDEIADESATSKGSIYFHFPNKERLFLSLVDQFSDLLEKQTREAIESEPKGIVRVEIALRTVLETFARYRRPAKILLVQAMGLGQPFEQKRMEVNERFARMISEYLTEAIETGELAADEFDVEFVSHAWMGAIYHLVIRWVYTGEPSNQKIVTDLVPILLRSVGHEAKLADSV